MQTEGYVFTDKEVQDFYDYFYQSLQKKLADLKKQRELASELMQQLCITSNILGDPNSKRSPAQSSFRRDLKIIMEGAGVGNCCLIVSDDCRLLDTVMKPPVVREKFFTCMKKILGIEFAIHVKYLRDVVMF